MFMMDNIVIEKLMFFNYNSWRHNIFIYLLEYNLWGTIVGMPKGDSKKIWEMK